MSYDVKWWDVFFVDDDPDMRTLMAEELQALHCHVHCFDRAVPCLARLARQHCHLLITDVKMPDMDGLALLERVRQIAPWVPVLVITGFGDIPMAVMSMKLGAADFIEKPLNRKAFLHKILIMLRSGDFMHTPAGQALTKTEKKVLSLILNGKANKEMAEILDRSLRTIETHRSNIMRKFGAGNIVDLVKMTVDMEPDIAP